MKVTVLTEEQLAEYRKKPKPMPKPKAPKLKTKQVYNEDEANILLAGLMSSCRIEVVDIKKAFSPCVYIWMDEKSEIKYVGVSGRGVQRALNTKSGHGQGYLLRSIDTVLVLYCETKEQASLIEKQLILAFQPPYNLKGK